MKPAHKMLQVWLVLMWMVGSGVAHAVRFELDGRFGLGQVSTVTWTPDLQKVLAATTRGIALFDTSSWEPKQTYGWDEGAQLSVAVSPDGQRVAGCTHGKLSIWDLASGAVQQTSTRMPVLARSFLGRGAHPWQPCDGGAASLTFSPDGLHLALHVDEGVYIWSIKQGEWLGGMNEQNSFAAGWMQWSSPGTIRVVYHVTHRQDHQKRFLSKVELTLEDARRFPIVDLEKASNDVDTLTPEQTLEEEALGLPGFFFSSLEWSQLNQDASKLLMCSFDRAKWMGVLYELNLETWKTTVKHPCPSRVYDARTILPDEVIEHYVAGSQLQGTRCPYGKDSAGRDPFIKGLLCSMSSQKLPGQPRLKNTYQGLVPDQNRQDWSVALWNLKTGKADFFPNQGTILQLGHQQFMMPGREMKWHDSDTGKTFTLPPAAETCRLYGTYDPAFHLFQEHQGQKTYFCRSRYPSRTVQQFDLMTGKLLQGYTSQQDLLGFAVSADLQNMAVLTTEGQLTVLHWPSGEVMQQLKLPVLRSLDALSFVTDQHLVVQGFDQTLLIDLKLHRQTAMLRILQPALLPLMMERKIWTTSEWIRPPQYRLEQLYLPSSELNEAPPRQVTVSADGKHLLVDRNKGYTDVYRIIRGAP